MIRQRVVYSLLLVSSLTIATFYSSYISFLIFIVVWLLPILLFIYAGITSYLTKVDFDATNYLPTKNDNSSVNIKLHPKRFFKPTNIKLCFTITYAFSGEQVCEKIITSAFYDDKNELNIDFSSQIKHCGLINIKLNYISFYDPILLTAFKQAYNNSLSVYVLPNIEDNFELNAEDGDGIESLYKINSKSEYIEDPSEIIDYRNYRTGDTLHRVNWKLSSRKDDLIIKEYNKTTSSRVYVGFQLEKQSFFSPEKYDLLLTALYSITVNILKNNMTVIYIDNATNLSDLKPVDDIEALQEKIKISYDKLFYENENLLEKFNSLEKSHIQCFIYFCNCISENDFEILNTIALNTQVIIFSTDKISYKNKKQNTNLKFITITK